MSPPFTVVREGTLKSSLKDPRLRSLVVFLLTFLAFLIGQLTQGQGVWPIPGPGLWEALPGFPVCSRPPSLGSHLSLSLLPPPFSTMLFIRPHLKGPSLA